MKPLKERARDKYVNLIRQGVYMTLVEFALRSGELLGEEIPYSTIKDWSGKDKWATLIDVGTFESSAELRNHKQLFDMVYDDVVNHDHSDPDSEISAAASSFLSIVTKTPRNLIPLIEQEIIAVREYLFNFVQGREMKKTHKKSLVTAWLGLKKFLYAEIIMEDEGVEADTLILSARER